MSTMAMLLVGIFMTALCSFGLWFTTAYASVLTVCS